MGQWMWLGLLLLAVVVLAVFFSYQRIAAIFAGFYHNKAVHLVLVTKNSQHAVEWRIWSYFLWNRFTGKKGVVTCIDTGSMDDTLKILRRLQTRYSRLYVVKLHPTVSLDDAIQQALVEQNHSKDKMIVLDLQESEIEEQRKYPA